LINNEWDQSLKFLTKQNRQSFVSFLLEGAQFIGERDKELQSRTIHADLVYEVQWHGETIILHAEFQRSRDKAMARRVWEYNVLIECATQLPVYSVVLYLRDDGIAIEPPYERRLCTGELIHSFHFRNLKLWEISASELRQPGLEEMLPLLPLTKDGARREMVEEVISDLARVQRQDLLPIAYAIAALVFPANGEDKAWLKERFRPMLNLFRSSWAYQDMVAEGKQEGLQEGLQEGIQKGIQEGLQEGQQKALQETCIRYVQKRFPTLADRAKQQINSLTDINRLYITFDTMMDATTVAEVEEILAHLSDEPQSTQ
jgi:hypothetical protein